MTLEILPSQATSSSFDLEQVLKFVIPKRVYDVLFYYQVLNQFHVLLYRFTVMHRNEKSHKLYVDFAKVENCLRYDGHNSLTFLVFNGYLYEIDQEKIQLFRNIEVVLSCDAVFDCLLGRNDRIETELMNFSLVVSVGKGHVPVDQLNVASGRDKRKEEQEQRQQREEKGEEDRSGDAQQESSKTIDSKDKYDLLKSFWKVLKEAKLTLEDFTFSSGPCVLNIATLQTSLIHQPQQEQPIATFKCHITSLKLFEAETKCFELPAGACTFDANPFGILQGFENSHIEETITNVTSSDLNFNITLTSPTIDLYHDQLIYFELRKRTRTPSPKMKLHLNVLNLLLTLKKVSTRIVIIGMKVDIHVPMLGSNEFHRDASSNLQTTYYADAIAQRTSIKDLSKSLLAGEKQNLFGMFKIKNFKANFSDNICFISKCNLLAIYSILDKHISLRLNTKHIKVKSINSAIFHLVREVRNRRIKIDNQLFSQLCQRVETPASEGNYELFEILPKVLNKVKVNFNEIQADIICKDGLPSQMYTDDNGQQFDLKDYCRGVSIRLGNAVASYQRDTEEISCFVRSFSCFTLSEFDLDYMMDFDVVSSYVGGKDDFSDISSLESIELAEREQEDLRQVKKVLDIDAIEVTNSSRDKDRLSVKIPEINGRFDIFFVWCALYASSLIHTFQPTVERLCTKQEIQSLMGKTNLKLKLDLSIPVIAVVTRLPNKVDVLTEFDQLTARDILETKSLEFRYFRGYIVHPNTKFWARFLTISDSSFSISSVQSKAFDLVCGGIRLNIPHGFLFYTVIDNVVTFAKAIKQISHNFNNLTNGVMKFDALPQEAKSAMNVPRVNIKTSVFGLSLESDPFESELSYIYELGAVEQRIRAKKVEALEAQAEKIRKSTIESRIDLQPSDKKVGATISQPEGPDDLTEDLLSEQDAAARIDKARELLETEFSTSWILKFKRFKATTIKTWKQRIDRGLGTEKVNPRITEQFDIMNYLQGPPLLGLLFKDFDFSIDKPSIPDLDKFLFDYGKGQPKVDYSILFPFFIRIRSSSVFSYLRDYAIPLVSFPENDDPTIPSFNLEGNIVINEKLIDRAEELRKIWVPFSPPMGPEVIGDNFYSVFVTRTLTPVKFTVDLNCKLDSERAAMISWCKSYQSSLSAAMSAVDNFTKPKIDDSPLGWWDKIALTLHGQMTFDIPNELCFHMKSSTNPYGMTGKDAGFVFSWKNNVVLKIDGVRSSKDLITLTSDDFLLAIPNYSLAEKRSWSLLYSEMTDDHNEIDSEARKYSKKVMSLSSDEKVQWTLGLLFERNKNNKSALSDKEERTNKFLPHYDVMVTGPQYTYHPDSYTGYRSDYLHLAISVKSVSKRGNSSNNIHLTPLTFQYFFFWWDTLTEAISLPIRQGPLFSDQPSDTSHTKTSNHLFTVKYQLILEPLTISHMQVHASGEKDRHIAFTGLKGKVDRCVLDLHQRKEVLTYVNKKLNIENQILHLKMNQAEISFEEADVRLVNSIFADKSMHSQLDKYLFGGTSAADTSSGDTGSDRGSGQMGYLKWLDNLEIQGGDFSWFDPEDFSELEMRELLSPYPKVTILPFFYTPQFTYIREFSLHEDGPFPFGNECSHDCELGKKSPESIQESLLATRIRLLHQELALHEETLAGTQDPEKQVKIKKLVDETNDKLDLVQTVYESSVGRIAPDESDFDSESGSISRLNSRRSLSVYSSHKSFDDARKNGLLDKEVSEFHNRFIVHNLQLKWANKLRDLFMNYMQVLSDKKSEGYFMSKQAVDLVESVLNNVPEDFKPNLEDNEFCSDIKGGEEIVNDFDVFLDEVDETQEAEHKFLVKLINPQIQLMSEAEPDSALLLASKDLELRIITVNLKGVSKLINADSEISGLIETRYGGLFNHSSIYVFKKSDTLETHPDVPYGYVDGELAISWPPWVEVEDIHEDTWLKDHSVTTKTSMALTFKRPNYLYLDATSVAEKNEINVYLGKIVINADSEQYSSLYYIVTDLLVHSKSEKDSLLNKLDKVISLSDNDDFYGLDKRVKSLQSNIREYHEILLKLDHKVLKLSELEKNQVLQVELELERKKLELSMIMRGLKLRNVRNTNKRAARSWLVSVDQIIWHFLDAQRQPLIDLALANSRFHRSDSIDGSNKNKLLVGIIQGFNLQQNAIYPDLLSPINETDESNPLILMTWSMLHPVGGIPIMQQAKLQVQPLKIQLDHTTAKLLFDYVFPKTEDKNTKTKHKRKESQKETYSETSSEITDLSLDRPQQVFKRFTRRESSPDDEFDTSSISSRKTGRVSSVSSDRSTSPVAQAREPPTSTPGSGSGKDCKIPLPKRKTKTEQNDDDIALIVSRSSKYLSVVDFEVDPFQLVVSFKAPKHLGIIDVHTLSLHIPNIRYQNKTWSGEDFILRLRKDITKIILQHTGHIIGNKFKARRRSILKSPLKQISNYASFVSVQDLQESPEKVEEHESRRHHHPHHHHEHSAPVTPDSSLPHSSTVSFKNLLQEIIDEEDESS